MANLKISQVEKTTNMDADAYVLVVQNGKNYRMSIKEAIAANVDIEEVDLSNYYTKEETTTIVNNAIEDVDVDLSNYYTKEETTNIINDSIEDFEIVSEDGNVTTITEVVNTVEMQAEQIVKLENIVQNINKDVATEEDAEATFDDIFTY